MFAENNSRTETAALRAIDWRGKRIVITGATGFLGGSLARSLVEAGADIHALARSSSDRGALRDTVTWHEGDVTVPGSFRNILNGADCVIHAAGRLGEAGVTDEAYTRLNVDGTRNVLAAVMGIANPPRVLHLSSPGVLGPTGPDPVTEDEPYAPATAYERSKAEAERVALEFAAHGLPVIVARPGFIYGPGDKHVLKLFSAIARHRFFYIGGGWKQTQPTFIADAVEGMLLCLGAGRAGGVYHITGPRPVTFRELGDTIAHAVGVRPPRMNLPRWCAYAMAFTFEAAGGITGMKPPLSKAGVSFFSEDRVFSWQKAHDEFGYTPKYDIAEGVRKTADWYKRRGWL